jgi:hypothetical protein
MTRCRPKKWTLIPQGASSSAPNDAHPVAAEPPPPSEDSPILFVAPDCQSALGAAPCGCHKLRAAGAGAVGDGGGGGRMEGSAATLLTAANALRRQLQLQPLGALDAAEIVRGGGANGVEANKSSFFK